MSGYSPPSGSPTPKDRLDSAPGPASLSQGMSQLDTTVNMDSVEVPLGLYQLPIHGNCPRCHHHHNAAIIKVSSDPNTETKVNCEHCGARWLSFGRVNSTCISLLSTETTVPDPIEKNVRSVLVDMVRSLSVVGSPSALASVPESPLLMSPVDSFKSPSRRSDEKEPSSEGLARTEPPMKCAEESKVAASAANNLERTSFPLGSLPGPYIRGGSGPTGKKARIMERLKRVKEHVRGLHWRSLISFKKNHVMTDKAKGKQPVQSTAATTDRPMSPIAAGLPSPPSKPESALKSHASQVKVEAIDERNGTEPVERPEPAESHELPGVDFQQTLEAIKNMTREERERWLRKEITAIKCRCNYGCRCRRVVFTTTVSSGVSGDTQAGAAPTMSQNMADAQARRRRSYEILGAGGHFCEGEIQRPTSIGTFIDSRATTAVYGSDGVTAVSSSNRPSHRRYIPAQRGRSRSRSPRTPPPQSISLPASPLRHPLTQGEISNSGESVQSSSTTAAVRSLAATNEAENRSETSTESHPGQEMESAAHPFDSDEQNASAEPDGARSGSNTSSNTSEGSIRVNGHHWSDAGNEG